MTITVAVYLRRSKEEQEDSIERQRLQVLPYCERLGYRVVEVYADDDRGWRLDRPGFRKLLADARAGKFTLIVVDEPSRLSRSKPMEFFGEVAWPLQQAGVAVESVARGRRDWDDIGDFIVESVDAHKSHGESTDLARRTLTGLLNLARDGKVYPGSTPFGYRSLTRQEGRRGSVRAVRCGLEPDPETAAVVLWLFEQYAGGRATRWLAQELTRRGVLPPRGRRSRRQEKRPNWEPRTVAKILRNRVYCGDYVWGRSHAGAFYSHGNGQAVPAVKPKGGRVRARAAQRADWTVREGAHPALISRELFEKVQERLKGNRRRTNPKGEFGNNYPLSGLLVCARCGSGMTGMSVNRLKGEHRRRYVCRGWMRHGVGFCKAYKVLEAPLLRLLVKKVQDAYLNRDLLDDLREEAARRAEGKPAELERLRDRAAELEGQIQRAEGNLALAEGPDDFRAVSTALKQLRADRDAAAAALADLEKAHDTADLEARIAEMQQLLWSLGELAAAAEPVALRRVLTELVEKVELEFSAEVGAGRAYHLVRGVITVRCPESGRTRRCCPPVLALRTIEFSGADLRAA